MTLELNKIFRLRQKDQNKIAFHARLVVGHIWKDDEDNDVEPWDFQAHYFDLGLVENRPSDQVWGGKCIIRTLSGITAMETDSSSREKSISRDWIRSKKLEIKLNYPFPHRIIPNLLHLSHCAYAGFFPALHYSLSNMVSIAQTLIDRDNLYNRLNDDYQIFARSFAKMIKRTFSRPVPSSSSIRKPFVMQVQFSNG